MKGLAQFELQASVVSTLRSIPELTTILLGGIFDGIVPATVNLLYPYAVIDSWTETAEDRLATLGRRVTFLMKVYSEYDGTKEAATITDIMLKTLNRRSMVATDWGITWVKMLQYNTFTLPDQKRFSATRFEIACQPLP